ncbi:MAG: DUF4126 domain-containing protein [bacterium]
MELIYSIITGLCLCAAVGFRVFVPLLILSIGYISGWVNLPEGSAWIGSSPALISFAAASLLEIAGYYNPWVDNMLDLVTTPLALFAGLALMSSLVTGINPLLKWVIVILGGGGTAINIHFLSVKARALSSFVITNGLGNPIFATIELFASVIISLLAVTVPLLSLTFIILIVYIIRRIIKIADRKRKSLII